MNLKLFLLNFLIMLGYISNAQNIQYSIIIDPSNSMGICVQGTTDGDVNMDFDGGNVVLLIPSTVTTANVTNSVGTWTVFNGAPLDVPLSNPGPGTQRVLFLQNTDLNQGTFTTGTPSTLFCIGFDPSQAASGEVRLLNQSDHNVAPASDPDLSIFNAGAAATASISGDGTAYNGTTSTTSIPWTSLPVELTSFRLHPNKSTFDLHWSSATEIVFDGYEIQRSIDGRDFEPVTWQAGKGGPGTPMSYTYTDRAVEKAQDYYYRLKMLDLDGSFTYSDVLQGQLNGKDMNDIAVFPNPTYEKITIRMDESLEIDNIQLNIFDSAGKLVLQQQRNFDRLMEIDVSQLTEGVYYVEVGEQGVISFTKN